MIVGTCPTKVLLRGPSHHGLGASGGYEEVKPCVNVSVGLGSLPVGRERRLRDVRTSHVASERRERERVTGREGEGGEEETKQETRTDGVRRESGSFVLGFRCHRLHRRLFSLYALLKASGTMALSLRYPLKAICSL